ncbi:squalene synthase HpnC [Undibacterium parvum]|uniref:Squalene synthase HpnC n=1 Tax=Undibacterium parvum TaxID=401471 RepID=A0A3S9HF82_9BURK|nr:squalene synthase HpnC [Undibacterium parvum]AZP10779.1 squalene synthase HpnC [Undibacterium parvum]
MSVEHYENFPVASLLMPAHLRPAVAGIYAFARTADDIADEGDASAPQRLLALEQYDNSLRNIGCGAYNDLPLFKNLAAIIEQHHLPLAPFHDLISAFKQDVVKTRYQNFDELLDYCSRSANPVGRIMLALYGTTDPESLRDSDAICAALQLINFWQDIAIDWEKQRVYVPREDLLRFGISEQQIADAKLDHAWTSLMRFQTERARNMLITGSPLCKRLPGRIGWELRLVVQGGLRILERLDQVDGDIFKKRPRLGKIDWLLLFVRALKM